MPIRGLVQNVFSGALALATLLAGACPASATTWNVSSNSDLDNANANALAGDVILIANNTYTSYPNPAHSATGSSFFYYVGNLSSPSSVVFPGFSISDRNVSLKGVTVNGTLTMNDSAIKDSLYRVRVLGDFGWAGNDSCVFREMYANGGSLFLGGHLTGQNSIANQMMDCHFILANSTHTDLMVVGTGVDAGNRSTISRVQYATFLRNHFELTVSSTSNSSDIATVKMFYTSHCTWTDNRWDIDMEWTGPTETKLSFVVRDSSAFNTFTRDTVFSTGPGLSNYLLSHAGTDARSVTDMCMRAVSSGRMRVLRGSRTA